jgi:hypothetical protein
MLKKTQELIKKFEQDHEVYLDAHDEKSYWVITARIPKKTEDVHHTHRMQQYVSARQEKGMVLIMPDPESSRRFTVENWGAMDTIDEFVERSFGRILDDKEEYDKGLQESCETSCS